MSRWIDGYVDRWIYGIIWIDREADRHADKQTDKAIDQHPKWYQSSVVFLAIQKRNVPSSDPGLPRGYFKCSSAGWMVLTNQ